MLIRAFRDHLPWVAPTVAIVFAASGYFDRSSESQTETVSAEPKPASFAAQPQGVTYDVSVSEDMVTRLATVTDSSLRAMDAPEAQTSAQALSAPAQAPQAAPQPVAAIVPPAPAPQPAPVAVASVGTQDAASFFADAQAKLLAKESCIADLRALTEEAYVYFPAGGLTADESGLSHARLIGSLVQTCDAVEIIVEGHSDPSGDPDVNLRLSQQRANLVVQRLGASGIDTTRFVARGMGDKIPSDVTGPESSAYYDRRVEFVVREIETAKTRSSFNTAQSSWGAPSCVKDLQNAIAQTSVLYSPRSIAVSGEEFGKAHDLAQMAAACPGVRLRVIGQHSDDMRAGESISTGILRAKAMMSMLVGKGIEPGQIIIAAPSRSMKTAELSGSRVDFDLILD